MATVSCSLLKGKKMNDTSHVHHSSALNLVNYEDATHVAINDGSWFDPNTWADNIIPGDDARVIISEGITVTYDGIADARLFTVRIDGNLTFATDEDSKMVVDTFVVDPRGSLIAGTADAPVLESVNIDIIIANNGDIDVAWDPSLLSRGIISLGKVEMHGQEKTTHLKVSETPLAGDTFLTLSEAPDGWEVGDTIVLTGTHYDGYKWDNDAREVRHYEPEDEVLTITDIVDNVIHFDRPLEHDHDTPREDLFASVANYSRNISVETENADTAAVHQRGHVMFMHSDDVDVRYVEFYELGRTDKSITALNSFEYETIASDSNVKGRYPFHFHRTGVDDPENPGIAEGNAVFGSPGWGYVHHDSNAILHDNASYDTFGAGFVAETGNEIGVWSSNIAVYAKGMSWDSPKNINDRDNFDMGKGGSGFYFQGRMVEAFENIAASTNSGFTYFHRGRYADPETGLDGNVQFDASLFSMPEALGMAPDVDIDDVPILNFAGNETFASNYGFFVEKANTAQGSDLRTHLSDFTAWEVKTGAHIAYTSHYLLTNFDVIGKTPTSYSTAEAGIEIGKNASDVSVVGSKIACFDTGIDISDFFTSSNNGNFHLKQHVIVEPTFMDVQTHYNNYNPDVVTFMEADGLELGRFEIVHQNTNEDGYLTYKEGYPDPDARLVAIDGMKTDSIGDLVMPAGVDTYDADMKEVIRVLEQDGYYSANGKNYFILEDYYSDRATGEIHKIGQIVEIDDNVPLGNPYHQYSGAKYNGEIDLSSQAPIGGDDSATTEMETDVIIDVLANDTDPDGDALSVDGIVQPIHGQVFDNGDGTLTYRPGLEFTGTETFKYWATDGFGNFTPVSVSVETTPAPVPVDDVIVGTAGEDTLHGYEGDDTVYGEDGNDTLYGDSGDDVLSGGEGHDLLDGGEGADNLYGDGGDDLLLGHEGSDRQDGGDGNDTLNGGSGSDVLTGGKGADHFVFSQGFDTDTIMDFEFKTDKIDLSDLDLTFKDLKLVQNGPNTLIQIGEDIENNILLSSTLASNLSESDFLF